MASADFSQFVVTTANDSACETSPLKVRTLFPHLPSTFTGTSGNFRASSLLADSPIFPSLICDSCPSGQGFAYSFLQRVCPPWAFHLTMDTLAVQLCASSLPTRTRDFHPLEPAHGGRTKYSGPGNSRPAFSVRFYLKFIVLFDQLIFHLPQRRRKIHIISLRVFKSKRFFPQR